MPNEYNFPCYGAHLDARKYVRRDDRLQLSMFMQDLLQVCIGNYGDNEVIGVGGRSDLGTIEVIFRSHDAAERFLEDWEAVAKRIRSEHANGYLGVDPADIPC